MGRTQKRLAAWRKRHGLTQEQAAERGGSGIWQSAWSQIESGKKEPSLAQAAAIELATAGEVRIADWLPKNKRPPASGPSLADTDSPEDTGARASVSDADDVLKSKASA